MDVIQAGNVFVELARSSHQFEEKDMCKTSYDAYSLDYIC